MNTRHDHDVICMSWAKILHSATAQRQSVGAFNLGLSALLATLLKISGYLWLNVSG